MSGINKLTPTTIQGNLPSAKLSAGELVLQQARITRVPQSLSQLVQATTLRGEVQGQNADGTTRIQTPRGQVDVKLDTSLPKGQRVDIQIPSGNPPREAIVQTAAPKVQPQTPQQAPQKTSTQTQNQPPAQNTQTQTPQQPPASTSRPAPSQPAQPTAPNQQPTVQQGSAPPPDPTLDSVKSLQNTAQQATQKIADAARQSIDPSQIVQTGNTQNTAARPLQTGQAVRLVPLPPQLQNPNGLASFPQAQGQAATQATQMPAMAGTMTNNLLPSGSLLSSASSLNMPLSPQTLGGTSLLQTPQTTFTANLKANDVMANLGKTLLATMPQNATAKLSPTTIPLSMLGQSAGSTASVNTLQDAKIMSVMQPVLNAPTGTNTPNPLSSQMTITTIVSPASPLQNLQTGQIMATVTGYVTPGGNPIVQIPVSGQAQPLLFALNYPATNLPKGTQIVMQPSIATGGQGAAQASTGQSSAQPFAWPVLDEAMELLTGQLSATQGQSLMNLVPRPAPGGHQFTAAALLFVAAARGGDISGWMGGRADQILRNLQATGTKRDIMDRLMRDISTSTGRAASTDPSAPAATQGSPEWRGYTLPLIFGMDIERMNLWTKPFGDEDGDDMDIEKAKGTRFIVDLSLSRMGNVQLDGLVQPYAKRLDLVLRTEHDFTPPVRQHLRQLWHNALNHIDMGGQLDFTKV